MSAQAAAGAAGAAAAAAVAASGNHSSTCTSSRVQDRVLSGATGCCAARGAGDSPRSSRTASYVALLASADAAAAAASRDRRQSDLHPHQELGCGVGLRRCRNSGDDASPKPISRVQQWRRPERCWRVSCVSSSSQVWDASGDPHTTPPTFRGKCAACPLGETHCHKDKGGSDCCAWWSHSHEDRVGAQRQVYTQLAFHSSHRHRCLHLPLL